MVLDGGKHYMAAKIIKLFPPHKIYTEVYAGGLSVLLNKDYEGIAEVVNDLNGELTSFWKVLQSPQYFPLLKRRLEATPFSQVEFNLTKEITSSRPKSNNIVDIAYDLFVRTRLSLAGRGTSFAPISTNRLRRGMCEQVSAWLSSIEALTEVHNRLKRVLIYNDDALRVIDWCDNKDTLFYLDPPYSIDTRVSKKDYGQYEVTPQHHLDLLNKLCTIKGKFAISGYHSKVYDDFAAQQKWRVVEFPTTNNASHQDKKPSRVEVVWLNY